MPERKYPNQEFIWWDGVVPAHMFNEAPVEVIARALAESIVKARKKFTAMDYVDASGEHHNAGSLTFYLNGVNKKP